MDLIQATWKQLPKIIPVFRKTLDEKKGYLSDTEIDELQNIMTDFSYIREEVKMLIMMKIIRFILDSFFIEKHLITLVIIY